MAVELASALPLRRQRVPGSDVFARPLVEDDRAALLEILGNDPDMTWTRRAWTTENVDYLLQMRMEHYAHGFGVFALVDLARAFVGMAGLQFWDDRSADVEVIAYVRKDRWGQGVATAALQWCVDGAFSQCPSVTRILAATRHDNAAAQTLARRLGMTPTGEGDHYGAPSVYWQLQRS